MSDSSPNPDLEREIAELDALKGEPFGRKIATYAKKCGPGWLQGAITLGGGSLSGALYLGVIMGFHMMWLQPLAMILGVIMLSAISYVTLSTGQRPFRAINENVSPVLGWGWLIATLMANIVWCLPQFSLGTAAINQNLFPGLEVHDYVICLVLLAVATCVILLYGKDGSGVKVFEGILKVLVGIVVLCFVGVVVVMAGKLPWGQVFAGLIPDFSMLTKPAPLFQEVVDQTGSNAAFWKNKIVGDQNDKMIAAFATAVGINMTFLLPYSMLRKGWGKSHRGLAIFDLSLGLIIPFVIATGCVLIASASQFHGKYDDIIKDGVVAEKEAGAFNKIADGLLKTTNSGFGDLSDAEKQAARDALPAPDKQLAAMLVNRDAFKLANALKPLTGDIVSQYVFGFGVLGMALSTIIILMLISGFTFCEMLNKPDSKSVHLIGCMIAGIAGTFAPFLWKGDAKLALAIPTSVIGGALLPIAYITFFLLMNSKKLLGEHMPTGARRVKWNVLMGIATLIATYASVSVLMGKTFFGFPIGKTFIGILAVMTVLGVTSFLKKSRSC